MQIKKISDHFLFSSEKMKKNNLFETDNFFCDIYCLEPGQDQKIHSHQGSDKFYYVLEGTGVFHVDGEERNVSAAHIVFCPKGSMHGVKNNSGKNLILMVVMSPKPS
jgi:quercetin dioxygenase-like cupin family protein